MTETKKSKPLIKEETDKGSFKDRYKDCIANLSKVPTVNIKGKQYSTVAERHRHLKKYFPESRIDEEIIFHDDNRVVVKTSLYIADQLYAVGHSEEMRNSSFINKTSALENAATSSLGRCIAAFGLAGSEYASADELTVALLSQGQSQAKISIKDKINQQTTETKLNKLYSDWEQENDQIKKSFENKQKNIKEDGGQNVKSNW
jgi:hypothetical protein